MLGIETEVFVCKPSTHVGDGHSDGGTLLFHRQFAKVISILAYRYKDLVGERLLLLYRLAKGYYIAVGIGPSPSGSFCARLPFGR